MTSRKTIGCEARLSYERCTERTATDVDANKEARIINDALKLYGVRAQTVVAIEELSELQKELCKAFRGYLNFDHLAEEIADVEIMLDQMKTALSLHEDVKSQRKYKFSRLEARIAKEDTSNRKDCGGNG